MIKNPLPKKRVRSAGSTEHCSRLDLSSERPALPLSGPRQAFVEKDKQWTTCDDSR